MIYINANSSLGCVYGVYGLLNELFGWNLPKQPINIRLSKNKKADGEAGFKLVDKEDEA